MVSFFFILFQLQKKLKNENGQFSNELLTSMEWCMGCVGWCGGGGFPGIIYMVGETGGEG
jgi:hypothetical protein